MPIPFLSKAQSALLNNTFLDKTIDDIKDGKLTLTNKLDLTDPDTADIVDAQAFINNNRDDIDTNTANIATNASNIATNAANIATNASDIQAIEDSVGQPNGIASLDANGKLPSDQLTVSAMEFLGNYDASTNTPTLIDGTGNTGDTYRVSVAGTQDFGSGSLTFQVGDWIYYSASNVWQKGDNIDQVTSVAGKLGDVLLDSDDITEVNGKYFTNFNNLTATADPTINNDNTQNYAVGSFWYNQTNDTLFIAEDVTTGAAVWVPASGGGAGGSGVGGFSYIQNGSAEQDINEWTVFKDSTPGSRLTDFGGTPDVGFTFLRSETDPLLETASFELTVPALNAQGNGFYYEYDTAIGLDGVMLLFSVIANTSELATGDLIIGNALSDDNFATFESMTISNPDVIAGAPRIFKQIQQNVGFTKGRLYFYWTSTDTTGYTAKFDQFFFGPKEVATSAVVLDEVDAGPVIITAPVTSPTKGASSIDQVTYRRVGSRMIGSMNLRQTSPGSAGTGDYFFTIPDGHKIDGSIIDFDPNATTLTTNATPVGKAFINNNDYLSHCTVYAQSEDKLFIQIGTAGRNAGGTVAGAAGDILKSSLVDFNLANTNLVYKITFDVPIAGWSSNATTSIDLGQNNLLVEGDGNSGSTLAVLTDPVDWTETSDSESAFNGSQLTATIDGVYNFAASIRVTTNTSAEIFAYKNGAFFKFAGKFSNSPLLAFNFKTFLNKGDVLEFRSDTSVTLQNSLGNHVITITRDSNSQTLLDTATVRARYAGTSGPTLSANSPIPYLTKDYDTNVIYNTSTGIGVVQKDGFYEFKGCYYTNANVPFYWISLYINGSPKSELFADANSTVEVGNYIHTDELFLNKGDTFSYRVRGQTVTLNSDPLYNFFTIKESK